MESRFGKMAVTYAVRAMFPHFCAVCGAEGETVCGACKEKVEAPGQGLFTCPGEACGVPAAFGERCGAAACTEAPLASLTSAVPYGGGPHGELIRLWKYGGVWEAEEVAARTFSRFALRHEAMMRARFAGAVVTGVPLHPLRKAARGCNQADALASAYAVALGLHADTRLLARRFGGSSQASLEDRAARAGNVAGMFHARRRLPAGTCVVLVDDVATTGATLRDCARALRGAGAGEVHATTLLRR